MERTFHQVIPIYGMPKDSPPHGLSLEAMVLDDPKYATNTFDAYVDMSRDYTTWFVKSSVGPNIGDVPMNGGRVLGGAVPA